MCRYTKYTNLFSDFFLESKCCLAVLAVGKERVEVGKPPGEGVWLLGPWNCSKKRLYKCFIKQAIGSPSFFRDIGKQCSGRKGKKPSGAS